MAKKLMWDPGHGGNDTGAAANGLQEEHLTFKIVEYAMAYLDAHYTGFEQRTTRGYEQTFPLSNRDDVADNWGADVFISVHINAGGGTGFESYIYNKAGTSTVTLQNMIHNEVLAAMRLFGSISDRGKKRADFAVLRETNMDAILTENLFIDSTDANYLKNEEFLKAVGGAHARGAASFLGLPKKGPKVSRMITGGINQNMMKDLADFLVSKNWAALTASVGIGNFVKGTRMFSEIEAWLNSKGWYFTIDSVSSTEAQFVTGGLNQQMMKELADYLVSRNWGAFSSNITIGDFVEGTEMFSQMEAWLNEKGWYFTIQ
ncbi:N-acetylmuramoyl-L-alanine amidase [Neobacillus sp. K501]